MSNSNISSRGEDNFRPNSLEQAFTWTFISLSLTGILAKNAVDKFIEGDYNLTTAMSLLCLTSVASLGYYASKFCEIYNNSNSKE